MTDKGTAYLFIDDAHIESLEDAAKGVVPAEKVSDQPLIEKDKPWEEGVENRQLHQCHLRRRGRPLQDVVWCGTKIKRRSW